MIKLVNVKKKFNNQWITKGVTLNIPKGQMTCIIGRSGEGKSVLLKQIIGLIKPTSGQIFIDDKEVTALNQSEKDYVYQKCGYVFQFAALLDSLTILENIGLPLLQKGINYNKVKKIVKEKLTLVNLDTNILHKYPANISGGMKKRVGLARTLITNPSIILYDEPTTGLDPINTRIVHELMFDMQKKLGITSVVISHDIDIFEYVDNIALLHDGVIKYYGSSQNIWESNNEYVYQFVRGLSQGPIGMEKENKY